MFNAADQYPAIFKLLSNTHQRLIIGFGTAAVEPDLFNFNIDQFGHLGAGFIKCGMTKTAKTMTAGWVTLLLF